MQSYFIAEAMKAEMPDNTLLKLKQMSRLVHFLLGGV